jgi:hypothetical protein
LNENYSIRVVAKEKVVSEFHFFPQIFADQDADFAETISFYLRIDLRYQRETILIFKLIRYRRENIIAPVEK